MKNIRFPIYYATAYLAIYVLCLETMGMNSMVLILFGLSPLVVIWMVYRVLKDGEPSEKHFEQHFYEDYAYERIQDGTEEQREATEN